MSVRTSYEPGTPSWVDLMTPSRESATAFYGALFGWTFEEVSDPDGNVVYTMCFSGGKNVCGLGELSPEMQASGMPAAWTTYVATADVDETSAKVETAGGTVMMPATQVFEAGRMAMYLDPTGAAIAAWEAGEHIGAELVNEPYGFGWNELNTRDTQRAVEFYEAVFGWKGRGVAGPMNYTEWLLGDQSVGGMMPMPEMVPAEVPAHWITYFMVEDADATVAKLGELGGAVLNPAMDIEVGRFAVVADPAGAVFCVMKLAQPQ